MLRTTTTTTKLKATERCVVRNQEGQSLFWSQSSHDHLRQGNALCEQDHDDGKEELKAEIRQHLSLKG